MACIGDAIEVFWPDDNEYYAGKVIDYDSSLGISSILYDDGEIEDIDLTKEQWRFIENLLNVSSQCSDDNTQIVRNSKSRLSHDKNSEMSPAHLPGQRKSKSRHQKKCHTVISKKNARAQKKRATHTSSSRNVALAGRLPIQNVTRSCGPIELLIGKVIDSWLLSEARREHPSSMFSASMCLLHARNDLAASVVDPLLAARLTAKSARSTKTTWIAAEKASYERRSRYDSWKIPLSDEEWVMEQQLLANISKIVLDSRDRTIKKKCKQDVAVVRALGVIICALERSRRYSDLKAS